jgi:hypothetical protein
MMLTRATQPDYRRRLAGRQDQANRATVSDPFMA